MSDLHILILYRISEYVLLFRLIAPTYHGFVGLGRIQSIGIQNKSTPPTAWTPDYDVRRPVSCPTFAHLSCMIATVCHRSRGFQDPPVSPVTSHTSGRITHLTDRIIGVTTKGPPGSFLDQDLKGRRFQIEHTRTIIFAEGAFAAFHSHYSALHWNKNQNYQPTKVKMFMEGSSTTDQADQQMTKAKPLDSLSRSDNNGDTTDARRLWKEELAVRQEVATGATSNPVAAFFVHFYSSLHIFVVHLISLESILSISLSVGMTICKSVL